MGKLLCPLCGGDLQSNGNGELQCSWCGYIDNQTSSQYANKKDAGVSIFDNNINGVLEVFCTSNKFKNANGQLSRWSGSGFLITEDGYAITNSHVAADEDGLPLNDGKIKVKLCGQVVDAKVIALGDNKCGRGNGEDLALLKIAPVPLQSKPLVFADFDRVRNGEQVFVIGNSLGHGTCITSGIVSDRLRKDPSGKLKLMTDCPTNHGNSGGPIFNAEGQVLGVVSSGAIETLQVITATTQGCVPIGNAFVQGSPEGMNYAIPVPIVKSFINKYVKL